MTIDVLVVGGGVAGLGLASAVARAGGRARVLAPHPPRPFGPTYGAWADELPPGTPLGRMWPDARYAWEGGERLLGRAYAVLDNAALLQTLLDVPRLDWELGEAAGVEHAPGGSTVTLADGRTLSARMVVDASGHNPALLPFPEKGHWQTAFGFSAHFETPPAPGGVATFMDYRRPHLGSGEFAQSPSFLYVLPQGGDRYFVQETVLSSRPAADLHTLQTRMLARLAALGAKPSRIGGPEEVFIRMDPTAPDLTARVLGYGAAGSMVNPASGYSAVRSLAQADAVAAALLAHDNPQGAVAAAWAQVGGGAQGERHRLLLLGHAALAGMTGPQQAEFFWRLFALPGPTWSAFLAHDTPPGELARTMLRVFARVPSRLRLPLVRAALSHAPAAGRGLLQGLGGAR